MLESVGLGSGSKDKRTVFHIHNTSTLQNIHEGSPCAGAVPAHALFPRDTEGLC